jgi:hypothetical protein
MRTILVFVVCFTLTTSGVVKAQDTLSKKEIRLQGANYFLPGRPWTFEVPLWIPGFAGEFAHGDVEIEGEDGVDPEHPIEPPGGGAIGKIISRLFSDNWYLKFFYLTKVAYERDQFLVQLDAVTGAVGESVKFNYTGNEFVKASFRTTNLRLIGGYKIVNTFSKDRKVQYELVGYLGLRAHFQSVSSDLGGGAINLDLRPVRMEPVFGFQNQLTLKRWFFVVQGDYGGYFSEAKNSFQLTSYVYFRTGKLSSLKFGWNHLHLDHSGIFLREEYLIDATFSGPSAGVVFHF